MASVLEKVGAFLSPFYHPVFLVAFGFGACIAVRYKGFGLLGIALIVFIGSAFLKVAPNTKTMVMPLFITYLIGYSLAWVVQLILRQGIL